MNIGEANAAATILYYAAGISRPGVGPVDAAAAAQAARFLTGRVHKALLAGPDGARVAAGIEAVEAARRSSTTAAATAGFLLKWLLDPHATGPDDERAAREAAQCLADHAVTAGHTAWTDQRVADAWPNLLTGCAGCPACTPPADSDTGQDNGPDTGQDAGSTAHSAGRAR